MSLISSSVFAAPHNLQTSFKRAGTTAPMHAVESFQDKEDYLEPLKDRVTRLINGGAEIDIQDIDGRNVLDICKSEDLKEYIRTKYDVYQSTGIGLK